MESDDIKLIQKKGLNSVIWSAIERFSVQAIQVLLSLVIARLISPSDYGLIAMLTIFIAIAQAFVDSGLSNALIQKKEKSDIDYSTAFYSNIAIAIVIYIILFFCAPWIADFYNEPLLVELTRWIGLNLIISAFIIVQQAQLVINLKFKKQAKLSLFSVLISGGLGIYLAYRGQGVWALVFQTLSKNIINGALLWVTSRWRPMLQFSKSSFKSLFGFGSKLLVGGLIHSLYTNVYSMVIGKIFNAKDVGLYNQAHNLASFAPNNITFMISRAVYPIECQLQDQNDRLKIIFIQYLRIAVLVIFPLMVGLSILSRPLINVLLTEKWDQASILLSIVCLAYMWQPIQSMNWQLLSVKGRTDLSLQSEIVKKIIAIIILIVTIPGGVKVMCLGLLVYAFVDMGIIIFYVKRTIGITYLEEIKNILPFLLFSLLMGFVVFLVTCYIDNYKLQLLIGIPLGILVYVTLGIFFRIHEFIDVCKFIISKVKNYK